MGLRDFVEAGRVAFINYGDDYGKLVVIVDMVDMNRVLVDGMGHFPRVMYPLRRLTLTRLRIPILRGARTGTLKKAAEKFELDKKRAETRACQKLERAKARARTTDFDRFKIMVFRKQRGCAVRHKDLSKMEGKKRGGKSKK